MEIKTNELIQDFVLQSSSFIEENGYFNVKKFYKWLNRYSSHLTKDSIVTIYGQNVLDFLKFYGKE